MCSAFKKKRPEAQGLRLGPSRIIFLFVKCSTSTPFKALYYSSLWLMWFTCFYCTYLHLCSVWSSWNTPGRPVFRCLINAVDLTWIIEFNMQKKQRKESWWQQCRLNTRHMSGSGVKMAITAHHFQQVVLLINKSYKEAISCSASALPLVKRKLSLSHTALNRGVLCGHTHLCQAVSQCQTFEPCLCWRPAGFCLHVWSATVVERGSIGEGLPIVLGSGLSQ